MKYLEASLLDYFVGDEAIVSGASVSVDQGELVALVGPNGAGKSTLVSILAGILQPTRGTVMVSGDPIARAGIEDLARRRSYLPADLLMSIRFTVREVVEMGIHPWSTEAGDEAMVAGALDAMGLADMADHVFSTLSTGEARRAQLARALVQDTPLLLLDEPASGLDIAQAEMVLGRLSGLTSTGKAVLTVMHDLNAAARVADRVVVMGNGEIVADGPPGDVLTADLLSSVYGHPIAVVDHPLAPGPLIAPSEQGGAPE